MPSPDNEEQPDGEHEQAQQDDSGQTVEGNQVQAAEEPIEEQDG